MKLKDGDRVILITQKYGISHSNPYYKSKHYKCIGTIVDEGNNRIQVYWDNGMDNDYNDCDLKLEYNELENCNNIWQEKI